MCSKSESIVNIAKALVAFAADVKPIEKDGTNPHFKSQYTTLDHMIDETKPLLQKHGLTVMQFPGGDGERITVRTMILHTSGEWMESEPLTLKAVKTDPQGAGSAITYARRYSYAAALSLSLGDDDDGNASSYSPQEARTAPPQNRQSYPSNNAQNGSQRQQSAQGGESPAAVAARVYKMRENYGWSWPQLTQFAGDVLEREVKYLKKDVQTADEWKKIEAEMVKLKEAYEPASGM